MAELTTTEPQPLDEYPIASGSSGGWPGYLERDWDDPQYGELSEWYNNIWNWKPGEQFDVPDEPYRFPWSRPIGDESYSYLDTAPMFDWGTDAGGYDYQGT